MRKAIVSLIILFSFILADLGWANLINNYCVDANGLANATGIVQKTSRNSIEIFDEEEKLTEGFIYFDQNGVFHPGDYIRIYYYPRSGIVHRIMKMTVLKYKANGQNLGNIYLQRPI